jgi:hypothetical protein
VLVHNRREGILRVNSSLLLPAILMEMSFRLSLWLRHNRDLGEKWSVAPHEGQLLFFLLGSEIASLKDILPLVLSFLFWILSFPFRLRPAIIKVRYHPL